jgi:hypothetical protein
MGRQKLGDAGRRIGLIRWFKEGEDWSPTIIEGIVVDHAEGIWRVDVNGEIHDLNESDWSIYQP